MNESSLSHKYLTFVSLLHVTMELIDDFIQNIFGATCQICLNPDFKALAQLKVALKLVFLNNS